MIRPILSGILIAFQFVLFLAGLTFIYAGLQGPTAMQEISGATLATAVWVLMFFVYTVNRDRTR